MDHIIYILSEFTALDYVIFSINLLLFVFSKPIVSGFKKQTETRSAKLITLRMINIILFLLYFSAFFLDHVTKQISKTGLILLVSFIVVHFAHMFILRKFGREKEIDGTKYRTETYQSEMFNLLFILVILITVFVLIINIWGLTDWLKATSVLGILAIIIFSTKDVWAPDNVNGLILLYNGDVEPGSVVRIDELNLLAISMQTTLSQTSFRDLRSKHLIVIANSKLRNCKIEILNKSPASGLLWFIDYNIGYGISAERVEAFFKTVWEAAMTENNAINPDKTVVVKLLTTADHAVTWRFGYWVKNIYNVLDTEFTVNKHAYSLSIAEGIDLATPLTHHIAIQTNDPNQQQSL